MDNSTKSSKRKWLFAISGGLLISVIAGGLILYPKAKQQWTAPLGPRLDLPTSTPSMLVFSETQVKTANPLPTETIPPISTSTSDITITPIEPPTATIEPTTTTAPLCGGPPVMYILAIGIDTKDLSYTYGLADVIRVARVDFITPKVTVLSIPRDLWVEIPGIEDHGITDGKINQSFFYGGPGMNYYDGAGAGPGLLAQTINQNLDLPADHYGALNMLVFERIVNAVGGIDIYLPTDVDGTPVNQFTRDMGYFYAGQNHFNGEQAVKFSRIRKRYSDYQRVDNQNLVLCALKEKLLNPSVLPRIPQIIGSFQGSVLTDLSLEQMSQLACLLPKIESENLIFTGIPKDILVHEHVYSTQMRNETYATLADMEVLQDYISQFKAGSWPEKPDEPSCQ